MLFIGRLCWWKEVHRDLRAPSPAESIPEDADQVSIVTRLIDVGLTLLRGGGMFSFWTIYCLFDTCCFYVINDVGTIGYHRISTYFN